MRAKSMTDGEGKLNFKTGNALSPRYPLAERVLNRFPKLASLLGVARMESVKERKEPGRLVSMMRASGSIDFIGRDKKNYQFHIRPMH